MKELSGKVSAQRHNPTTNLIYGFKARPILSIDVKNVEVTFPFYQLGKNWCRSRLNRKLASYLARLAVLPH